MIALLALNQTLVADLHRQLDQRLVEQASGAAQWVGDGRRHPDKLAERLALIVKADVTIFDPFGEVIGDSSDRARVRPGRTTPLDPPEVRRGAATATSGAPRGSLPSGEEMRYVAVPAADGLVVRLGAPLAEIHATVLAMQRRLFFASALAIALALGLGFLASQFAARPLLAMTEAAKRIAKGDYDIDLRSASPDEFGLLSRTLTILADELKARIGDLVAERDRLSAILAGMAEGVVVTDAQKRIILANPAAAEILGGTRELVGTSARRRRRRSGAPRLHRGGRGGGAEQTHESEVETAGGKSIAIYVRALAPGADGSAGGSVTVLRDMTRMRRLLTMRRDFVANVSHELRTPVAAIQGYAETLLEKTASPATQRQFLEIIHRQSQRIGALVADLLTLSELQTKPHEEVVREAVDLGSLASNVIETLRGGVHTKDARVEVDVDGGGPRFRRSDGARAGDSEPRRQRAQVRQARRRGARARRHEGRARRADRERRRPRDRARAPAAPLRALLPRRPRPVARARGDGARAGDREAPGRVDGGRHRGEERGRPRDDLPGGSAGGVTARRRLRTAVARRLPWSRSDAHVSDDIALLQV